MFTPTPFRSFVVVPAAGRSQRMGQPKLLLPWGGTTIIGQVLAAWKASRASQVVVVLHPDDQRLAELCSAAGAVPVVPSDPTPDMKASVCLGLEFISETWLPTSNDVWLLAPADMPLITTATIDQVLETHMPESPRIVLPRHEGWCGHPVLFPWALAAEVARLPGEGGISLLLRQFPVYEFDCPDPGIFTDLDTPEDYQRLQGPRVQEM